LVALREVWIMDYIMVIIDDVTDKVSNKKLKEIGGENAMKLVVHKLEDKKKEEKMECEKPKVSGPEKAKHLLLYKEF
jgi:hypothetical protein